MYGVCYLSSKQRKKSTASAQIIHPCTPFLVYIPEPERCLTVTLLTVQVRVSRKNMLLSAEKVMETYASHRAVLELEYFGEVGTGLGPTLEFYTLLSHEMQRKGLAMWRSDTGKDSEAAAVQGNSWDYDVG